MYKIGIDIGGMSIKVGLVKSGKIIEQNRVKTAKTAKECIDNIVKQINELLNHNNLSIKNLKGIGVERRLAKANVASSNLVSRSIFLLSSFTIIRRHRQVVRPGSAKPLPPVRIWVAPPKKLLAYF